VTVRLNLKAPFMKIIEYRNEYEQEVMDLIRGILHDELGVNNMATDQVDLKNIKELYQQGNGNFWIALNDDRLVGTIALIDIGKYEGGLKKMFVHPGSRGKEKGVAQELMDTVMAWCRLKGVHTIYLGPIDIMKAAHRFYEKNGFVQIGKDELPGHYPAAKVDNVFYKYSFVE
jgi:N-acetylglutamate synthase-like GNAT family acetyltransferase